MKKIIAFMLIVMLVMSMAGCSSEGEKPNNGTQTGSSEAADKDDQGSVADDNSEGEGDRNAAYTTYDDLPYYEKIPFHEIYISIPDVCTWRDDKVAFGWNIYDSNDYVVVITYNDEEEKYTGAIEDILDATYDGFTNAVGCHAVTEEFGEYDLTVKEKVTLDCGAEAMRFEGTMSANQYSAVVDYYIYGYSFVYDDSTITVGASIDNPDVIDAKKDTMKDIVDRMVKTVRTQP